MKLTQDNKLDLIKEIHQFLSQEIDQMNESILKSLSTEEELVNLVGNYIANSCGKRIRPILTLLTAKMYGNCSKDAIKLATSVEFIHMATLLHDDVVDGSKLRRFLPSANVVWGSKASILVGDFLFSQSFKLMVSTNSIESMRVLSDASVIIAEGEVAQLAKLEEHRLINEAEYFKIINSKTAKLFSAACEVGAVIANADSKNLTHIRNFGMDLGNMFQLTDDLLDYFSESDNIGKNIGDDFVEGKVTLPIIFLAKLLSINEKNKLIKLLFEHEKTSDDFLWVKNLLFQFKIKEQVFNYLENIKISAYNSLKNINIENKSKEYLKLLVDFVINRSY